MKSINVLCLALCAGVAGAAPHVARQSDASYAAAFRNQSTSPSFVLVTVIDGNTGESRPTCLPADFLLGAIHIENGLGWDPEDQGRALQAVFRNSSRVFTFENEKALYNVARHYTDAQLDALRKALQGKSVPEVVDAGMHDAAVQRLVPGKDGFDGFRSALVCVLIERGESPSMADMTGQILVR